MASAYRYSYHSDHWDRYRPAEADQRRVPRRLTLLDLLHERRSTGWWVGVGVRVCELNAEDGGIGEEENKRAGESLFKRDQQSL